MEKKIIICACASRKFIDKPQVAKLATVLTRQGFEVKVEDDLCRMVEQNSARLEAVAESTVIACHERAVRNLLKFRGYEARAVFDLRQHEPNAILKELEVDAELNEADKEITARIEAMEPEIGQDAWFPVIDEDRCINCRKCHDFCLFGVYAMEGKKVKVVHPENCKNNCPACARTCPKMAVIFPKYTQSPINGGVEEEGETAIRIDTNELYNQALRERLANRRSAFILNKVKK